MTPEQFRNLLTTRHVQDTSPLLLGATLRTPECEALIVEVEAYAAHDDPASHAFHRKSPRNAIMFGPAGNAYVYFTYGNHWMLCVVTHPEDDAAAILVRAAYPLKGQEIMQQRRPKAKKDEDLLSGPGKLAAAFALDGSFNGLDLLTPNDRLELIPAEKPRPYRIGTRIGIATGKGELTPWRFVDAELGTWASRPHLTGPTIEAKAFPLF